MSTSEDPFASCIPIVIRPAILDDSGAILALRNDPESVFWSGHPRISETAHTQWFPKNLPNILVLADLDGVKGYARVAEDGRVSLVIDPTLVGRGYGRQMLMALAERHPGQTLYALVHPSNIASMRAFLRAGYCLENTEFRGIVFQRVVKRPTWRDAKHPNIPETDDPGSHP